MKRVATARTEASGGRRRLIWWVAAVVVMAAIFFASSIPDEKKPPDPFKYADKSQHFVAYGILGWTLYGAIRTTASSRRGIFWVIMAIGMASLYGITDEVHQYFTPGRCTEFLDWAADTIGASVAVIIAHLGIRGGSNH